MENKISGIEYGVFSVNVSDNGICIRLGDATLLVNEDLTEAEFAVELERLTNHFTTTGDVIGRMARINTGDDMKVKEYREWRPTYSKYDVTYNPRNVQVIEYDIEEGHEMFSVIGLVAEAGELLGVIQKARRSGIGIDRAKIVDELGDVFWYFNYVMDAYKISYDELTNKNRVKLDLRNAK